MTDHSLRRKLHETLKVPYKLDSMLSDDELVKRVAEIVKVNKRLVNRLNLNAVKARRKEHDLWKQIGFLRAKEDWEPEW